MGLIRELYDELIPLPTDKVHEFNNGKNLNCLRDNQWKQILA